MQGYFDIHSHILPGIDDGPDSLDETLHMLSIAYEEGFRIILATPHYVAGNGNMSSEMTIKRFNELNEVISASGLDLNIILGNELYYNSHMIEALKAGDAYTIDGTRYILVEFPINIAFQDLWRGLNHCIFAGYIPILAHVERYYCLIKEPGYVEDLIQLGSYMQMNLSSIHGRLTNPTIKFCHLLLKKEWVHFLGTDAHGARVRTPCMKEAVAYIKKRFGEDRVKQLLWDNPMTMLEDNYLR